MFTPKTERIEKIAGLKQNRIIELEQLLDKPVNVYIDFANVLHWQDRLQWNVDVKRLKQFLDSFDTVKKIAIYCGTLIGDIKSEDSIREFKQDGLIVKTKPVKIMYHSIDVSSISRESPEILKQFIKPQLLGELNIDNIKYLNAVLSNINRLGKLSVEAKKCNFDVEIGIDMLMDYNDQNAEIFVLWSGDSDFYDPLKKLLSEGKKVILFATSGKVSKELNELKSDGLIVFDIQKIKEFICWKKQIKINGV
ncbi:MAG: hypothetical protein A2452_09870 [Candidatus Firestonebacteria bacterium RIFOXYC2_FULL_39_67]|nr:MAG: hypothetical protein A2536_04180 [Candidatus Firestonebacteria bacterium RIFOXYD2_FULL_39_29]OGF55101.1 MAG: hypothetical protein A2452_09870 [Candidatus Firestonebacteria bacterium RIFOXYC2_FULL_39_67]